MLGFLASSQPMAMGDRTQQINLGSVQIQLGSCKEDIIHENSLIEESIMSLRSNQNDILERNLILVPALRGFTFSQQWKFSSHQKANSHSEDEALATKPNPLKEYFDSHQEGHGIWKWEHYFDIYHRHFSKFVGREVHVLEVGIYSGGSLDMWKAYFGPKCHVIGVDIEEGCKVYEDDRTKVFVGDQADREFWKRLKEEVPVIDIVIDDGGHLPEQQIVTLEEMLPHLNPNGVYLCEDVHGAFNIYTAYVYGIANNLNAMDVKHMPDAINKEILVRTNEFQRDIRSIHLYPFVTVIEKGDSPVDKLVAPKHGTQWQPFL